MHPRRGLNVPAITGRVCKIKPIHLLAPLLIKTSFFGAYKGHMMRIGSTRGSLPPVQFKLDARLIN